MPDPVVLVTGGSRGIGRLTVEALAPHARAVYCASRSEVTFPHENVHWLPLDVSDAASVRAAVAKVLSTSGRIDVLVNNAGVMLGALIEETPFWVARQLFDVNFWGAAEVTAQVMPAMRRQRGGHVIFVGSLAGRVGTPGQGFYSAAKFALSGYAETLAYELGDFGVRVNVVEPSFHRTELHEHMLHGGLAIPDYDPIREDLARLTRCNIEAGDDPRNVAETIRQLVVRRPNKLRHPVGRDARWVPRIKQIVPEEMFTAVVRRKFGLALAKRQRLR